MTSYQKIRNAIEKALALGKDKFIIYPFGENGLLTKQILNNSFDIIESYIIDNGLSRYNAKVKSFDFFKNMDCSDFVVLLTSENPDSYNIIRNNIKKYFKNDNIIDIFPQEDAFTKCGKYSYGPLCNHWLVESVGAFCSFAAGSNVTENHPVDCLSTHPFIYADSEANSAFSYRYDDCKESAWYFPGVRPRGVVSKLAKVRIGNDVWLGKNVTITNGSMIGNGVIAGAGAVITKDVPDYAIVAGVPARIIRYRYTPEQIEKLNAIAWWNWSDDVIRERYDDFYLEIEEFIEKYYRKGI